MNYAILGWNAGMDALFEPLHLDVPAAVAAIYPPVLPTAEQLDLAELQARLVLNRLNADSTEDLQFSRTQTTVEIKGIVEDTPRRDELVAQLKLLPHVTPAIFSVEELKAHAKAEISSVKAYSAVAQPSPLEQYFKEKGKDAGAENQLSAQLLDAAASAKQESCAISELIERFSSDSNLGEPGRSALAELVSHHSTRLAAALDDEDALVDSTFDLPPANRAPDSVSDQSSSGLSGTAERNMALCRELTGGNGSSVVRPAESIVSDLLTSTQQIRNLLRAFSQAFPQPPEPKPEQR